MDIQELALRAIERIAQQNSEFAKYAIDAAVAIGQGKMKLPKQAGFVSSPHIEVTDGEYAKCLPLKTTTSGFCLQKMEADCYYLIDVTKGDGTEPVYFLKNSVTGHEFGVCYPDNWHDIDPFLYSANFHKTALVQVSMIYESDKWKETWHGIRSIPKTKNNTVSKFQFTILERDIDDLANESNGVLIGVAIEMAKAFITEGLKEGNAIKNNDSDSEISAQYGVSDEELAEMGGSLPF